ncbi:carbohydrate ABC transporter permease [Paracoccus hibiscisoli]|uniref:Sugar ABC transporter permease n=1 Tax=Paracoccus hibiscisoli TaxID=2023261 RepID=A0A4U0QRR0_9RHOB|nr:sugar ABC transporter permease [Paracoccus hibiscisoli]TJZ84637.1 sugar ABC transporter permease [Paracoccus hibiscisoli]
MTTAADRRMPASVRMRRALTNGRVTAVLIMLPPALILFTFFVMLPLGESAWFSFFNWNGYGAPSNFVGLENYDRILNHSVFHIAVGNTVKIVVISLIVQMPLAMLLALLIYKKTPTNAVFRLIFFLPYILAEVAAGLIWSFVFDGNYGVTASIAGGLGMGNVFILSDPDWAFAAIMTVIVWKYFGFHMMIYIAALQSVPQDQIEAARIEGARRLQVIRYVQIPAIKPAIVVSAFFAIIGALQVFDVIIPLTNGGPSNQTHTIVTYLYTFGLTRLNIGFGSAVGVILFVGAVTVALFYQRIFMKRAQG